LHLMGLLDTPTRGELHFKGKNIARHSDKKLSGIRNREIGFVFQFHHLLPDFTAWENIAMPLRIGNEWTKQGQEYGRELISFIGLEERLEHLPSELSGGERQRLALARALIYKPTLLLADEPSGNLDEKNTESLHQLLNDVHKKMGVTIVLVTHDEKLAQLANKQYLMLDGGLVEKS